MSQKVVKALEVGPLLVHRYGRPPAFAISEPLTGCRIAFGFPTEMHAATAAKQMNEVADWVGCIKTRAKGLRPNCQDEIKAIAERFEGYVAGGAGAETVRVCAETVARIEAQ